MVDWKLYIDSPQKRALHSCGGSLDEGSGYGGGGMGGGGLDRCGGAGWGCGYGDIDGDGVGARGGSSWGSGDGRSPKIW